MKLTAPTITLLMLLSLLFTGLQGANRGQSQSETVQVRQEARAESPDRAQAAPEQASPAPAPTFRQIQKPSSQSANPTTVKSSSKRRGLFSFSLFGRKGRKRPAGQRPNIGGGTSLVFGIVGLILLMEFAVFSLVCGLIAVLFGILGMNNDPNITLAVIGTILGGICLLAYALVATGALAL